ncbi:response regulator SirA [Actinobacillus pleuropneumoniae]|nr:response regulator SirA [Actinobacillus pleuropneumoniae]
MKSCSQGGVRGGAATVFYPLWHLEAESLLVLKNNRGVEDNRCRHMDYGVQLNKLMYQRLIKGGEITLFSRLMCPVCMKTFLPIRKNLNSFICNMNKTRAFVNVV